MTTADQPVLEVDRVEKRYRGGVRALRGVSLRVEPGQIFGLLGPNGAGKSTLVKILLGIVRPTNCDGTMLGAPVGDREILTRVGYLPEHIRFPGHLTGAQALHYVGRLLKVPADERRRRAGALLDRVGLAEWSSKKVGGYSKGMKQRLGIAQALINDPDLVFLDEPTDGVDPMGRRHIREMLIEMRGQGKTVIVNSHLLGEVESVTDRVAILVKGLVRRFGAIDDLAAGQLGFQIEHELHPAKTSAELIAPLCHETDGGCRLRTGERVHFENGLIRVESPDAARVQPLIDELRKNGVVIRAFRYARPSLEDLFIAAVEESDDRLSRDDEPASPKGSA
jgi:ABC-2 type transport system ATP-binding protein